MKAKKDILQEYLVSAEENLIRIGIRTEYVQNRHAQENKNAWLQELAELTANRKETEDWITFLKTQLEK